MKYRQFGHLIQFIVPMSSYGDLSELVEALREVVANQRILGQVVPRSYMELEKYIIADRRSSSAESIPVKTWDQFRHLAALADIRSDDELKRSAELLRNIGTLVWFDDDHANLSDGVITDSQFLAKVFSTIVTTKQNYAKDGVLDHSNLVHIWKQPQFPPHLHPQLLALLEKFEICYRIDQKIAKRLGSSSMNMPTKNFEIDAFSSKMNASSVIPCLLPNQRPAMGLLWKAYDGTCEYYMRIYELLFVPKGLFSRFLVRLLHYSSHVVTFWRSGIMAAADDSLFLVELFESRRWIMVSVKEGVNAKQRFREIIEILEGLIAATQLSVQVKRIIPCPHCLTLLASHGGNFVNWAASLDDSAVVTTSAASKEAPAATTTWLKPAINKWKGFNSSEAIVSGGRNSLSTAAAEAAKTPGPKIGAIKAKQAGSLEPTQLLRMKQQAEAAKLKTPPSPPPEMRLPYFFSFVCVSVSALAMRTASHRIASQQVPESCRIWRLVHRVQRRAPIGSPGHHGPRFNSLRL
jgi:hypothetical protein